MQLTQKIGLNGRTLPLSIGIQWVLIMLLVVIGLTSPVQKAMALQIPDGTYTERGGTFVVSGGGGYVSVYIGGYGDAWGVINADGTFQFSYTVDPFFLDPYSPFQYTTIGHTYTGRFIMNTSGVVTAVTGQIETVIKNFPYPPDPPLPMNNSPARCCRNLLPLKSLPLA